MVKAFKIGDALDSIFGVANNIASKAKSVDYNGIYTDLKQAVKQTDEELANVAKGTLLKNIDGSGSVTKIQETARNAGVNDVAFTRAVNNLTSAMKKQDLSEAHKIATEIDRQYQPGQKTFQDLVIEADLKVSKRKSAIESADADRIKTVWTNDFANTKIPNSVKNFTTVDNRKKIANAMYHVQGAKKYFATDDPSINQKRLGVAVGGYAAVTSGMRIINGGTPLTNEYGERDIAGIPFI